MKRKLSGKVAPVIFLVLAIILIAVAAVTKDTTFAKMSLRAASAALFLDKV